MMNWVLCLLAATLGQQPDSVVVELSRADQIAMDTPLYVGQHVPMRIELWIDAEFQQQQLVSLFRHPLDVPVELRWPEEIKAASAAVLRTADSDSTAHSAPVAARASLVVDGSLHHAQVLADRYQGGRRWHGYRVERTWVVAEPEQSITAAEARYGYATRFRDDLINGRVAEDQQVATVQAQQPSWQIQAVPEQGRPHSYTGAMGSFSLQARLIPTTEADAYSLALDIHGDGNWGAFAPPPWPLNSGFHCLGIREDQLAVAGPGHKRFLYELQALTDNASIPALSWSYFDPNWPAGYRSIRTTAFNLDGTPVEAAQIPPEFPANDTAASTDADEAGSALSSAAITTLLLLPWALLAVALWRIQVGRQRALRHQATAEDGFEPGDHNQAEQWDADAQRLADELARQLRCLPAALICPNLEQRLRQSGIEAQLAAESAEAFELLIAVRYGGPNGVQQPADVDHLVQRFRAASSPT